MPGRLFGKTAIITGSSSGLDRAIAHVYAQEGAQICCVDLYPSPTTSKAEPFHNRIATGTPAHEALRETYGGRYIFVCADLTKAEDVERAVVTCANEFGRLDVIVNNAGISVESTHVRPLRIHETAEDGYDKIMAVNAKEAFLGCKYAIPRSNEDRSSLAHAYFVAQSICLDFNLGRVRLQLQIESGGFRTGLIWGCLSGQSGDFLVWNSTRSVTARFTVYSS
jgi:NAD(P)-dependent dehydrogenase (short-subunit alcohol dehydrogenase family)